MFWCWYWLESLNTEDITCKLRLGIKFVCVVGDIHCQKCQRCVCVSYYHFYRMLSVVKYRGNFTDFCKLFTSGRGKRLDSKKLHPLTLNLLLLYYYLLLLLLRLVPWLSGRTLVYDQRAFAVLHSTDSWRVTTYVGKPSAIGQPTRPTQPFILLGSINE